MYRFIRGFLVLALFLLISLLLLSSILLFIYYLPQNLMKNRRRAKMRKFSFFFPSFYLSFLSHLSLIQINSFIPVIYLSFYLFIPIHHLPSIILELFFDSVFSNLFSFFFNDHLVLPLESIFLLISHSLSQLPLTMTNNTVF